MERNYGVCDPWVGACPSRTQLPHDAVSYVDEEHDGRLRLRLLHAQEICRNAAPPPGMPPLTLMLLDAFAMDPRNGETLDTARDCGESAPHGLALVGEAHLVEAVRSLVREALVEVAEVRRDAQVTWQTVEVRSPTTDEESLLAYWYRPTAAGHAVLEDNRKALDRYYVQSGSGESWDVARG